MPAFERKSGYLPGFDGWRAIAIFGVLMVHDNQWNLGHYSNFHLRGYGGYGVELFFAISGLLISWRVLEDEARRGAFHIRSFYIRRLFRIQPAQWVYLAVIALLMLLGLVHERWHFWFGALFLYQNFTWRGAEFHRMLREGWFTGHFWTLAVEEHFYLLLSLFFFFIKRRRILWLSALLTLLLLCQAIARHHGLYSPTNSFRRTPWIIQYLIFPALAAMLLRVPRVQSWAMHYLHPWSATLLLFLILIPAELLRGGWHALTHWSVFSDNEALVFYFFTFLVASTMLHPHAWTTRLLETRPLRFIGRLSYSFYLWHLLFFSTTTPDPGITWPPLVFAGQRPWRYVAAFAAALLSYHLVEKPMIRLGHKLAPPATPGHADLRVTESTTLGISPR